MLKMWIFLIFGAKSQDEKKTMLEFGPATFDLHYIHQLAKVCDRVAVTKSTPTFLSIIPTRTLGTSVIAFRGVQSSPQEALEP